MFVFLFGFVVLMMVFNAFYGVFASKERKDADNASYFAKYGIKRYDWNHATNQVADGSYEESLQEDGQD